MFKPTVDNVLIEFSGGDGKSKGGLHLPEGSEAAESMKNAVVVDVGPDVKAVEKDDVVLFRNYVSIEIEAGEKPYIFVKEEDILAIDRKPGK